MAIHSHPCNFLEQTGKKHFSLIIFALLNMLSIKINLECINVPVISRNRGSLLHMG